MKLLNLITTQVHAQAPGGSSGSTFNVVFRNPLKANSIQDLIVGLLEIIVELGAIVAVFFFIYSGFLFVKAQGNDEQLSKAKSTLLYTTIGTVILLGAQVIAVVLRNTVQSLSSF
jgi:hypothetical protein